MHKHYTPSPDPYDPEPYMYTIPLALTPKTLNPAPYVYKTVIAHSQY